MTIQPPWNCHERLPLVLQPRLLSCAITSSFCTEHLPAAHLASADPLESWLRIPDGQLWQWVIQPGVGLVGEQPS